MNKLDVIITTEYRGVFYGQINPEDMKKTEVEVKNCRNVRYWSSKTDGFQGLAVNGPNEACKISAKVPTTSYLHKVTSITQCTPAAATKWQQWN